MIGQTVSHYKILEQLGGGGMGVVYTAEDTKLDRTVALKFLPPELTRDPEAKQRFVHEAKAASALQHNNICTIHEIDETDDGRIFICMDLYRGETLREKMAGGPLPVDEAIDIVIQAAEGLSKAYEVGMVHRDIKPANIMLTSDGVVKIVDFGLAKLAGQTKVTKKGTTVGTVAYMSPEQASGEESDHRSDIFSLGVVLYELLAGEPPFKGEHEAAVLYGIMQTDPKPLAAYNKDVSPELQQIVSTALEKDRTSRYQTVADMLADLEALRSGSGTPSLGKQTRTKIVPRVAALVLAVALIMVAAYVGFRQFSRSGGPSTTAEAPDLVTIAVLPFVNMSSDAEQEYFSDGLTEELMNVLVKIPELRVTGRKSAFSFKNKNEDLRTIGQKLSVANILEGSVRKTGEEIRITAQLIEASSGFQLWSEIYTRTLSDIFAVQDDIVRSVAQALEMTLVDAETGKAERPDAAAYDLVLQARFAMQNTTEENVRRAREITERALAIDPDYAPAWSEMGVVHLKEGWLAPTIEAQKKADTAAREALQKALSLDPELALAHSRMGYAHQQDWDFEAAERSHERAQQLAPRNPIVMGNAGILYTALGRLDEAIDLGEQRLKIDPLDLLGYPSLANWYREAGRLEEAEALARQALEFETDFPHAHFVLAKVYLVQGRVEEARVAWERYTDTDEKRRWMDVMLEYTAGNAAAADTALDRYEKKYGTDDATGCAMIHAWRGETDEAFEWLEKAYAARESVLGHLKVIPELESLHSDPRWNALLEKVGLPTD